MCFVVIGQAAMTGGKILLVGMGTRNITLPLSAAALREVDILGSFRYANTYAEVLRLLGVFAEYPRGADKSSTSQNTTSTTTSTSSQSTTSQNTPSTGEEHVAQDGVEGVEDAGEGVESAVRWPTAPRTTLPDLTRLITHTFPLADTQKAFEMMRAGVDAAGGMVMKVVIQ